MTLPAKPAKNVDKAKALVEGGYEYGTYVQVPKLFRKRKQIYQIDR